MSQWEKLLQRLYKIDPDLSFSELRKILESYGYNMRGPGKGSSHFTFRKAGCNPVTIPKSNPIGKKYIESVRAAVEREATK